MNTTIPITIFLCQIDYNDVIKKIGFDKVLNYSKIDKKDVGKYDCSVIMDGQVCHRVAVIMLTYLNEIA